MRAPTYKDLMAVRKAIFPHIKNPDSQVLDVWQFEWLVDWLEWVRSRKDGFQKMARAQFTDALRLANPPFQIPPDEIMKRQEEFFRTLLHWFSRSADKLSRQEQIRFVRVMKKWTALLKPVKSVRA